MTEPKPIPIAAAISAAERIAGRLAPLCRRIVIAGSIRRRRPMVNDIDLVIETDDREAVIRAVKDRGGIVITGDSPKAENTITRLGEYQLDLFFTRPRSTDLFDTRPCNFGSILLLRTGSKLHNITLIEAAKKRGLVWNPTEGVFRGRDLIASETEEEIYAALDIPFLDPIGRRESP